MKLDIKATELVVTSCPFDKISVLNLLFNLSSTSGFIICVMIPRGKKGFALGAAVIAAGAYYQYRASNAAR